MRILVIFSWDDDISQARQTRMREDRRLKRYDFHQRFALPSPGARPEPSLLYTRISMALESIKPDVLLIHAGAAYHRSPQAFAECLLLIRKTYPDVRLGLERGGHESRTLERLGIFEESSEMKAIENDFFD